MIGSILLLIFGWFVHEYEKPLYFALAFAAVAAAISLVTGASLAGVLLVFAAAAIFAAIYFHLLDRFSHTVPAWFAILLGGAVLWFIWPFILM